MQQDERSLNGLMPWATRSLATNIVSFFHSDNFEKKSHLRVLHNDTPKDDARTLRPSHFRRATSLAIWKLPATRLPKLRKLDQEEQKILQKCDRQRKYTLHIQISIYSTWLKQGCRHVSFFSTKGYTLLIDDTFTHMLCFINQWTGVYNHWWASKLGWVIPVHEPSQCIMPCHDSGCFHWWRCDELASALACVAAC